MNAVEAMAWQLLITAYKLILFQCVNDMLFLSISSNTINVIAAFIPRHTNFVVVDFMLHNQVYIVSVYVLLSESKSRAQ